MIYLFLFAAEAVFTVLFIRAGYPEATKKGFVFKMFASGIFVLTGLYNFSVSGKSTYALLILCGLVSGLAGDIFLTFDPFIKDKNDKKKSAFFVLLGGVFFLAGHIIYMAAFIKEIKAHGAFSAPVFICAALGVFALVVLSSLVFKLKLGKAAAPVAVYALAISCMFALALCLALSDTARPVPQRILLAAAPLLFIISDTSLMFEFFDKERFNNMTVRSINLGTYFLAQMIFAMSILNSTGG